VIRSLIAALLAAFAMHAGAAERLVVFAAASLKNALDETAVLYKNEKGVQASISYGASSALARQIEKGAQADVFLSADRDWMDYLEKKDLLAAGTRRDLLGNRLVLVAPAKQPQQLRIAPGFGLAQDLGNGRIALADPRSVPAGKYAKAALEKLGVWDSISTRVAATENVRAALALVARGETRLGIVYATDAQAEPAVMVAGVFPADTHPPIVYPVAALKGAKPGAAAFLELLRSPAARVVFEKHGFTVN
jgi:molybdate transport system substrate-binding protein